MSMSLMIVMGIGLVLSLLANATTIYGQSLQWSELHAENSPPARRSHAMAFDPENRLVVMFGGYGNGSHLGDTWVFDPRTEAWNRVSTSVAPSPRAATTLVYEPQGKQLILFGGFAEGHSIVHNDTWAFTTSKAAWTNTDAASPPSARASYGMTYDSKRHLIVLFGGFTEQGYFNDVWLYDPARNSWEERQTAGEKPSPRGAMGFVYDEASDVFVMFGGFSDSGFFGDTWILDLGNNTWAKREPETHPPPARTRMLYVPAIDKSVFFGGDIIREDNIEPAVEPSDKVWSYDFGSGSWLEIMPTNFSDESPAKRSLNGIAYDSNSESIMIFGGTDALIDSENFVGREFRDTWTLALNKDIGNNELTAEAGVVATSALTAPIIIGITAAAIAVGLFIWKKGFRRIPVR